jgi:molecular chaperone DnaK
MKNNPKTSKDNGVINIGIDLGTTNSAIAISRNGKVELIKSGPGQPEYTPSVFGIDKSNNKVVGQKAYEKLFKNASDKEFDNYKAEVKRLMGTADTIHFERLNKSLTPEEVSAEILISLKETVSRNYPDFSCVSAVITIPAYFSTLQSEATKRAGEIAGFKYVVLLQEPIAAAMAYGLNSSENQNWLVYDLGGGTFDVALISSKDGILTVLGQNGDNHLGGKDFDLLLVDEVIKPAIANKYSLEDFDRSNNKYKALFARLKAEAETAKIELSQNDNVTIEIDDRIEADDQEIFVSLDFTRKQFEELIKPSVKKTLDLAQKTLKESGVKPSSIAKIILVGGPTQIPYIRDSLKQAFNCDLDTSVDPLTVVAHGACVYGLSQRIPQELLEENHKNSVGEHKLELHYDAMTAEEEQTVAGKIEELKATDNDYYVQIQSDSGFYSSSKIKLKNGKFFDQVAIEKGKPNTYWIYLFDKDGNTIPVFPDSFTITHGMTPQGAPIPYAIGVVYRKNSSGTNFESTEACDQYFDKGATPPLSGTKPYKTARKLIKGKEDYLPVKVYEGNDTNPDNNMIVSGIKIDGTKLPYDLPEGTDVDVTIRKDKDMSVFIEVYIPSIELTLRDARADIYAQSVDTKKLMSDVEAQKERIKKVEDELPSEEREKLNNSIDSIDSSLKNVENDTDDRMKTHRDLQELKSELDKIEQDRSIPQLNSEFREKLDRLNSLLEDMTDESEKNKIKEVLKEIEELAEKAVKSNDKVMLVRLNEQLQEFISAIFLEKPDIWIYWLNDIKSRKSELSNQAVAEHHISKADEAIENEDIDELKRHVRELFDLLPKDIEDEIRKDMAGITK